VNSPSLRISRATTNDLPALRDLWTQARLLADDLEKRLTEFQVVRDGAGQFVGAIGVQFSPQNALLHNEGFTNLSLADDGRNLFWERLQILASNHGVFRVWTQERSPFWKQFGFRPADALVLARLPAEWRNEYDGAWLTFQLKNEDAITAALGTDFARFMESQRQETARVRESANTVRAIVTVVCFAIGILSFAAAIYLALHRAGSAR